MKNAYKEPQIKAAVISDIKEEILRIMEKHNLDNRTMEYAVIRACNDITKKTDLY